MREKRMTTASALFAVSALVVGLAACQRPEEPGSTSLPEATADEQQRRTACRQWASAQSEREFARVQADSGAAFGRTIPMRERFDRFDAEQRRQSLYQRCMAEGAPQSPREAQ